MQTYYLGADIGGTKTLALIADQTGRVVGAGFSGPGNHESVGYAGQLAVLSQACDTALIKAGISRTQLASAGFGIAGFDWATEREEIHENIRRLLEKDIPFQVVNDALVGMVAGSSVGWGIGIVSGTGCNCWGWDASRERIGRVTGAGLFMGEGAGASEMVQRAIQHIAHQWSMRGPKTSLSDAFMAYTGTNSLDELLEGLLRDHVDLDAAAAPLIFEAAAQGDAIAREIIQWAGVELAELVKAVARQLQFEALAFDVVKVGSVINAYPQLSGIMETEIHKLAPQARIVGLEAPPAAGGILLAMEKVMEEIPAQVRQTILETSREFNGKNR